MRIILPSTLQTPWFEATMFVSQTLHWRWAATAGPSLAYGHHLVAYSHGCSEKRRRYAGGTSGDRNDIIFFSATETPQAGGVGLEGYP